MNEHIKDAWLEAYYDDELSNGRLNLVEKHLSKCAQCRTKLENLGALSVILHESPGAENLTSPSRFVAQVGLRLPDRPSQPTWQRVLVTAWQIIPVGLIGTWAFVQTVFILAALVFVIAWLGLGGELVSSLARLPTGNYRQAILLNLALTALTGILSLSWLASWWVSRSNGKEQNLLIKNR
jgi:anti-sigma factor RsiW